MISFKRVPLNISMKKVADAVLNLRALWQSRSDAFPFYTLGKSAYLDGKTQEYFSEAEDLNPVLMRDFKPLYDKVASALSEELGEKVFIKLGLALPAFHIFPSDKKLLSISGNWHIDIPHITLGVGDKDASAFTVPIMLPTGGGGMEFSESSEFMEEDQYCSYVVGQMILHDGKTLHRISSYKKYKPDEYRITLQGHVVRDSKNNLIMFW
jgi:hypothetical protein